MSTQTGVLNTPVEITKWTLKNNAFLSLIMTVKEGVNYSVLTPLEDWDETLYKKDC